MNYSELYSDKFLDAFSQFSTITKEEQETILSEFERCLEHHWTHDSHKARNRTINKCRTLGVSEHIYDSPEEILDCEELIILIFYPFWERVGPSFADEFASDGRMLKYLQILKKRDIQYQLCRIVKAIPFDAEAFISNATDLSDINEPFPKEGEMSYKPTTLLIEAEKSDNNEAVLFLIDNARKQYSYTKND